MAPVRRHFRRHLVGYAALVLALSPSAYAASTAFLPTNSVGSRQVIDHSLGKVDLAPGTLARPNVGPKVRTALDSLAPGRVGETMVICRGGRNASGGGVALLSLADNLRVLISAPGVANPKLCLFSLANDGTIPNAWDARVQNTSTTEAQYEVFVVCS